MPAKRGQAPNFADMMIGMISLLLLLQPPQDSLRVLFWNLENYFDWRCDSTRVADIEFSSRGARHWTRKRFTAKSNAIAKGLLWAGSRQGGLPDLVGLAEVENAFVLRRLLQTTALRKLDYRIVHFDSPDPRGIDVALLYRSSRLALTEAKPCHLYQADSSILATRDILLARFRTSAGKDVAVLVNHHPSKYGGAALSAPRRRIAVERLKQLADSLLQSGVPHLVAMGDMNDTPDNPLFGLLEPSLKNLALPLHQKGEGTIKFEGQWQLIDMLFVSKDLAAGPMEILHIPFLLTADKSYGGYKPLRTYAGPRYLGGVSDHCPVWLTLVLSAPRPLRHDRPDRP